MATLYLKSPITAEGIYTVQLPEGYLKFSASEESFDFPASVLIYRIEKGSQTVALEIVPPAGAVESLTGFTIYVPGLSPTWKQDAYYKQICATLTLPDHQVVELPASSFDEVLKDPDNFWSPILGRSYEFDTTYTALGEYELTIPAGMFYTDEGGNNVNPEWKVIWHLGTSGVEAVGCATAPLEIYTIDGKRISADGGFVALKSLPAGLYIVNGKKTLITR